MVLVNTFKKSSTPSEKQSKDFERFLESISFSSNSSFEESKENQNYKGEKIDRVVKNFGHNMKSKLIMKAIGMKLQMRRDQLFSNKSIANQLQCQE